MERHSRGWFQRLATYDHLVESNLVIFLDASTKTVRELVLLWLFSNFEIFGV